jgi:predicted  nucleic acid-binding Zn-ribbon protein
MNTHTLYNSKSLAVFLLFLGLIFLSNQGVFAQIEQEFYQEIESYEAKIMILDRQIAKNNSNSNSSANSALESEKKAHEKKIDVILVKIERLKSAGSNDGELEYMALRKELDATEAIVVDLEKEILTLNKEINRLTLKGGSSSKIEKIQAKVETLQKENKVLKQQIVNYRKASPKNSNSSSNPANEAAFKKLEARLDTYKKDNKKLKQDLAKSPKPNTKSNNEVEIKKLEAKLDDFKENNQNLRKMLFSGSTLKQPGPQHIFKQFKSTNAFNFVMGYRYTFLPTINFTESANLYQGGNNVGYISSISTVTAGGHNCHAGVEWMWNGKSVGSIFSITGHYSNYAGPDIHLNTAMLQLAAGLRIIPLRTSIIAGINIGGTWGTIYNYTATLDNQVLPEMNPEFSSMVWGFDAKLRFHLFEHVAFIGSFGADYAFSFEPGMDSFNTMFRYGVGLDFIIAVAKK